jgi:hypothetical protein
VRERALRPSRLLIDFIPPESDVNADVTPAGPAQRLHNPPELLPFAPGEVAEWSKAAVLKTGPNAWDFSDFGELRRTESAQNRPERMRLTSLATSSLDA